MKHKSQLPALFSMLLILTLLAACGGQPAAAPTATPVPPTAAPLPPTATPLPALAAGLDDATISRIEAIVKQAMTDYPVPGMTMCVVKDGRVIYSEGFGLADTESGRVMTPQSVSNQASVSKSLTAMAVMQLVEQGKIDLDKPVTAYLPDFTMADARYKDITVRMLLSHTSGLPESPTPWATPLDQTIDPLAQAVGSLSDQELLFAPGEQWSYSAWGYSMLGELIARTTGEPFTGYMQTHWLQPLGMANSTYVLADVNADLRVTGYVTTEVGTTVAVEADRVCDPRSAPACGLWSNCEDMAIWAQLLLNQGELNGSRLLQPESIDTMWTSAADTPWLDALGPWYGPPFGAYGLGWYVGTQDGHRLAGHAGAEDGFNTQLQFAPDDGLAVISVDNWLNNDTVTWYPASFAAVDVLYELMGVKAE